MTEQPLATGQATTRCSRSHALVTGASSGIGHATTRGLARAGYHVFATVRRAEDGQRIGESAGVTACHMDVTDLQTIQSTVEQIEEHVRDHGLDLVVNNAGIGVAAPIEAVNLGQLRNQLDVNVVGQVAVTQAVLPLVRAAAGRIIMVGSIGDRLVMPFAGPLAASKFAVKAVTEALRQEVRRWGVRVVLLEPASIYTPAVHKLERDSEQTLAGMSPQQRSLYQHAFSAVTRRAVATEQKGSPPDLVAKKILRIARARKPKPHYLVGKHSHLLALVARLPSSAQDRLKRRLLLD